MCSIAGKMFINISFVQFWIACTLLARSLFFKCVIMFRMLPVSQPNVWKIVKTKNILWFDVNQNAINDRLKFLFYIKMLLYSYGFLVWWRYIHSQLHLNENWANVWQSKLVKNAAITTTTQTHIQHRFNIKEKLPKIILITMSEWNNIKMYTRKERKINSHHNARRECPTNGAQWKIRVCGASYGYIVVPTAYLSNV